MNRKQLDSEIYRARRVIRRIILGARISVRGFCALTRAELSAAWSHYRALQQARLHPAGYTRAELERQVGRWA